ncbi:MAG: hypothetical protein IPH86_14065 [bacterium]|nr:hypothetical protein [bacterium]
MPEPAGHWHEGASDHGRVSEYVDPIRPQLVMLIWTSPTFMTKEPSSTNTPFGL